MEEEVKDSLESAFPRREIQETITPSKDEAEKATEEEFFVVLKTVSPGTNLRVALEGMLKGGRGALVVIENDKVLPLIDGGFRVNCRFTHQKLIELSKMDGAIVLSKDIKKINNANVLLTPDSKIKTSETGTRHKAAERTSKQTGTPVIAISERRHEISLFYKNYKYVLKDTSELRKKANENIQLLEKQRELFDSNIKELTKSEMKNCPNLNLAVKVMQKGLLIQKITRDMRRTIIELGSEATLLKTRMKEILTGIESETDLIIKDYTKLNLKKSKMLLESLSYDEIINDENILKAFAYELPASVSMIKGWRVLSKTSLMEPEVAMLIKELESLGKVLYANDKVYKMILGEEKAESFKQEIGRMKFNTKEYFI